jgi:hypothetical protein
MRRPRPPPRTDIVRRHHDSAEWRHDHEIDDDRELDKRQHGLLLGCASSGLIALSAIYYPVAIRSTGVGWATGIGRLGSVAGPLAVGQMVGAQWDVPTIFLAVGGSVLIGAAASALMGLLPRAGAPDALAATPTASLHA